MFNFKKHVLQAKAFWKQAIWKYDDDDFFKSGNYDDHFKYLK